jgi:hypothetical protein
LKEVQALIAESEMLESVIITQYRHQCSDTKPTEVENLSNMQDLSSQEEAVQGQKNAYNHALASYTNALSSLV